MIIYKILHPISLKISRKIHGKTLHILSEIPMERDGAIYMANHSCRWDVPVAVDLLKSHTYVLAGKQGTTRRKEGQEFGNFDRSFIVHAKKTNSVVCPITVLWTGCKRNKIVVNFGKAFYVEEMTEDEAMEKFMKIQREGLEENKRYMEKRDMR